MNENFIKVNNIRIYNLDYLADGDLADDDVNYLMENKQYYYSFIAAMYKFVKSHKSLYKIIDDVRTSNEWLKDHLWSNAVRAKFEKKVAKAYQNIFRYGEYYSKQRAEWFSIYFGFATVEATRLTKYKRSPRRRTHKNIEQ